MNIENIIKSCNYLEFINNLDNLIFKLLYSEKDGYVTLKSKDAIDSACNILLKFNTESSKILSEFSLKNDIRNCENEHDNLDFIIEDKKRQLIFQIKKHYNEQTLIWCEEIYKNLIDNCLLALCADKDNKDEIYNRALCSISWFCTVLGKDDEDKKRLVKEFNYNFNTSLKSDFENSNSKNLIETDRETYIFLWDMLFRDYDTFLKTDIEKYSSKLTNEDFLYFSNIQKQTTNIDKIKLKDEMILINTAIELMELKKDKKYAFIKIIQDELLNLNKNVSDEDKITLIKRRMKLFNDEYEGKLISKYYKNYFLE